MATAVKKKSAAAKKSAAKKTTPAKTAVKSAAAKKRLKDPHGGLTAAGREYFEKQEGAHLRPGVQGAADTPDKMRRKGSFLRRMFGREKMPPLVDKQGRPTRLALSAQAWGEKTPKTEADARKLADKGAKLLEKYQSSKSASKSK